MSFRYFLPVLFGTVFVTQGGDLKSIDSYRDAAAKANAQLTIPDWEQTPGAIEAAAKDTIKKENAALDAIGKLERPPKTQSRH